MEHSCQGPKNLSSGLSVPTVVLSLRIPIIYESSGTKPARMPRNEREGIKMQSKKQITWRAAIFQLVCGLVIFGGSVVAFASTCIDDRQPPEIYPETPVEEPVTEPVAAPVEETIPEPTTQPAPTTEPSVPDTAPAPEVVVSPAPVEAPVELPVTE